MTRKASSIKLRLATGALFLSALFAGVAEIVAQPAPPASSRLALVIGEAAYATGPLSSAANDAGLVADTLQQAGFDVTGAADLDQEGLRRSLREFLDKAAAVGPDGVVFIYLSGRAVQYEGENYLAPVEAGIPQAANVPLEAVRLNDYLQPLSQLPLKARIVVLDAARMNAFAQKGPPLAGGLALVEPPIGGLYAFNAAPGSVAPNETGAYGVYAQSLTEMLREGGLPLDDAFARARLRVSEQTKGALIPWHESKLTAPFALFSRAANAPAPRVALEAQPNLRAKPIRDYPVEEAFTAALEQDTMSAYVDFLNAYPNSAYAARVRAILALRREALTWRRAYMANTPVAYWTYLRRYPAGPHAEDARLRLGMINAAMNPPPQFAPYEFDVPPPLEADDRYFRRHDFVFDDDDYGPPPPRMDYLLPQDRDWVRDEPPHAPRGLLPLIAAPLLFAIPAVRQGLFHAPAVVQAQQPGAQDYYKNRPHPGATPVAPGATPVAPGAPGATPVAPGAPAPVGGVPHPGAAPVAPGAPAAPGAHGVGAPLPHPGAAPVAPAAPAGGSPLPHPGGAPTAPGGAPTAPGAGASPHPGVAPVAPVMPAAPAVGAPHVAPVAPPAPAVHPAAPPPAPPAAHVAPPAPPAPHVAPPPPAPHLAPPPPAPHVTAPPPPPHLAPPPPAPHVAPPPPPPHVAPPAPHPAPPPPAPPHAAPPPPPHAAPHPACGGHGEPPCH